MTRLIDADALKADLKQYFTEGVLDGISAKVAFNQILHDIDNAPAVEPFERIGSICEENCGYNPQGEYFDMSKLRLMTVEECAGHTIDYAMGWKACIEWIKNGGDMKGGQAE